MKRIFLTLAVLCTLLLLAAFALGFSIDDAAAPTAAARGAVRNHMLLALAALVFATLVHAIWLTYFMGTGRWIDETCTAYKLDAHWHDQNRSMKYRTIPAIFTAFLLLLATGGFGAAVDPASSVSFKGWGVLDGATIHFLVAAFTLAVNLAVNLVEYLSIETNGRLIEEILAEVRRIRTERGLPV